LESANAVVGSGVAGPEPARSRLGAADPHRSRKLGIHRLQRWFGRSLPTTSRSWHASRYLSSGITGDAFMTIEEQDLRWVQRLQAQDERALAELYDRHLPLLYAVVLRILRSATEAEDVLQEAWLQVWKSAATYEPKRGPVAAWLLMIARSRALDRYCS
jgi:sigma-70-like protein